MSTSSPRPHVAVYFSSPGFSDPPFDKPAYAEAYRALARVINEAGADCSLVRGANTFLGAGSFAKSWQFDGEDFHEVSEPRRFDVLYNKGEDFQADPETAMVNSPALDALCRHKEKTAEMFPEFFPRSALARSEAELRAALQSMRGDTVVTKPTASWGGHGVTVGARDDALSAYENGTVLVQEFVDTSRGIPGITEGLHDFRLLVAGGEVVLAFVRTPPEGKKVANLAQGGTITVIPLPRIPKEPLAIAKAVDEKFAAFGPRVYSVDFGLHQGKDWKLFEINPQPGLTSLSWNETEVMRYYRAIAREVLAAI